MFWGQPGLTICHLRLLLWTGMFPHWSGSRHFTAVSVCTFRKHSAQRNPLFLSRRHWDEVVLDRQEITTIGCPQPTSCGWPDHSPCTLMWDAPAGIPRLWLHSVVCSCCVRIPVWLPVVQEEQKSHMQLLSKMPNWCCLSTPELCLWTLIFSESRVFKSYVQNDAIHALCAEQTGWLISGWTALMVTHHT